MGGPWGRPNLQYKTMTQSQSQKEATIERWYVFAVSYRKEMDVQDELSAQGFITYIPMRYCLRQYNGKKSRQLLPAISGLVFVKGGRKQLLDFRNESRLRDYMFLKSHIMHDGTLQYVVVRDADMDNFRKLNDVKGVQLTYFKPEELNIAKGSKIKIMDGPFEGITGVVQKLPGKRGQYLIVSLPDVAIAAVSIKPQFVEPIEIKVKKSENVEKDTLLLARKAMSLLMGKRNDKTGGKDLIINEIKQLMASLKDCKTFLPNDKAHFQFAFYAAHLALGEEANKNRNELEKLLPRLKPNNLLLPTANLIFYYEDHEELKLQKANDIINKWDNTHYTDPQRNVIMLRQFVLASARDTSANNN